nr:MAG TPA: hypothetical protein [Bacteriophage sp.]
MFSQSGKCGIKTTKDYLLLKFFAIASSPTAMPTT